MSIKLEYDGASDTLTIEGVKYAGDVFRSFAVMKLGTWMRIESRTGGVLHVRRVDDKTDRIFDAIAEVK